MYFRSPDDGIMKKWERRKWIGANNLWWTRDRRDCVQHAKLSKLHTQQSPYGEVMGIGKSRNKNKIKRNLCWRSNQAMPRHDGTAHSCHTAHRRATCQTAMRARLCCVCRGMKRSGGQIYIFAPTQNRKRQKMQKDTRALASFYLQKLARVGFLIRSCTFFFAWNDPFNPVSCSLIFHWRPQTEP